MSTLHKLSFIWPIKVSHDGPPDPDSGSVIHAENPTHDVFVDVGSEGQSDLLGNSRTAPGRIPPLHLNDGVDELLTGSFWTGLTSVLWGKQQPVLDEDVMEMQQSGRLHNVLGRMRA